MEIAAKDLQLGDTINAIPHSPWGTAIVVKVAPDYVTLFRPYGTTADFSCSAGPDAIGVIPYIGSETYSVSRDACVFHVYERKGLK